MLRVVGNSLAVSLLIVALNCPLAGANPDTTSGSLATTTTTTSTSTSTSHGKYKKAKKTKKPIKVKLKKLKAHANKHYKHTSTVTITPEGAITGGVNRHTKQSASQSTQLQKLESFLASPPPLGKNPTVATPDNSMPMVSP